MHHLGLVRPELGLELELALAQDREDPSDLVAHRLDPHRVVELPGRELDAQIEQRLLVHPEPLEQLGVAQVPQLPDLRHLAHPPGTRDELRLDRKLVRGAQHRLARELLGHAGELEHHAARFDHGDPAFGIALARTHPGLGGLLRDGLVGEDVDPHLPAAADVARDRDAGRLDLAVRDPRGLERHQPEVTEVHLGEPGRAPAPASPVHLAVLDPLRREHQAGASPSVSASSVGASGSVGAATSGAATSGAATSGAATSGAATSGAATSGAATSGAATSGAATSGAATSGAATSGAAT